MHRRQLFGFSFQRHGVALARTLTLCMLDQFRKHRLLVNPSEHLFDFGALQLTLTSP